MELMKSGENHPFLPLPHRSKVQPHWQQTEFLRTGFHPVIGTGTREKQRSCICPTSRAASSLCEPLPLDAVTDGRGLK